VNDETKNCLSCKHYYLDAKGIGSCHRNDGIHENPVASQSLANWKPGDGYFTYIDKVDLSKSPCKCECFDDARG